MIIIISIVIRLIYIKHTFSRCRFLEAFAPSALTWSV